MSVQVRRRREAASFLSSYVGAQGELIVDTTNNRVQIHDGITPNGWPAAGIPDLTGRNLLLNGNFSINQRGYASGGALATGAYAHDRWRDLSNTSNTKYTFSQAAADTMIAVTGGTLGQIVDAPNNPGGNFVLSWVGSCPISVYGQTASGNTAFSSTTSPIKIVGLIAGTQIYVQTNGVGTLGLVQLEAALPSAGPTRFERRHGELVLCQRYFEKSYNQSTAPGTQSYAGCAAGIAFSNAPAAPYAYVVNTAFKVTKRATPTVTLYSIFSGAVGMAYDNTAQKDVQALSFNPGDNAFQWYAQVYASTGSVNLFSHFTAVAEI